MELLIQRPKRREVTLDSEDLEKGFLDSETCGLVVSARLKGLEPLERVIAVEGEEASAAAPWVLCLVLGRHGLFSATWKLCDTCFGSWDRSFLKARGEAGPSMSKVCPSCVVSSTLV